MSVSFFQPMCKNTIMTASTRENSKIYKIHSRAYALEICQIQVEFTKIKYLSKYFRKKSPFISLKENYFDYNPL